MERWATFDCYGTLVDWNAGICGQLARVFGEGRADQLLLRYHELERQVEAETPTARYREVMAEVMRRLGAPEEEQDALGRSLPDWPVFPEVPAALAEARRRGWRLAALSNTDREFIDASIQALGVQYDEAVVASEIGSYKPAHGHWEEFFRRTGADRAGHVHVAQSHFHDVVPANELGLRSIWINRLGERREPPPTRELPDLERLPDTLDELVPA
ncbi:MAG: HAD-IA family hydrolase [Gaiellaceae bacterium]